MYKRFPVMFFLAFFLIAFLSAESVRYSKSVSVGSTIDIAPFGIEKKYLTVQTTLTSDTHIGLALQTSFSAGRSSYMIRIPLCIRIEPFHTQRFSLSGYGGFGLEKYKSELQDCTSPFITGGFLFRFGNLYTDFNVTNALRPEQDDKDAGVLFGYVF